MVWGNLKSIKLGIFHPKTYATNVAYGDSDAKETIIKLRHKRNNLSFIQTTEDEYNSTNTMDNVVYMISDKFIPHGPIPSSPSIDVDMPMPPPPQVDSWVVHDDGAHEPRFKHNSFGYDGDICIIFGKTSSDVFATTVEAFNIVSNTWSHVADIPVEYRRTGASVLMYNDILYIIGGINSQGDAMLHLDSFSMISKTFSQVTTLPYGVYDSISYFDRVSASTITFTGGQGDIIDDLGFNVYSGTHSLDLTNIAAGWVRGDLSCRKIGGGYAKAKCGTEIIVGSSNFILSDAGAEIFADRIKIMVRGKDDLIWSSQTHHDFDWGTCSNIGIYDDYVIFAHTNENQTLLKTKKITFNSDGTIGTVSDFDDYSIPRVDFSMIGFNNELFISCGYADNSNISVIEKYCKPRGVPPEYGGGQDVEN